MQLLILDDHTSIRGLLVSLFKKDFKIQTGNSGLEGIQILKSGFIPDLILLDIMMPELNGIQFLDYVRSSGIFSEIPVIMLSGVEDRALERKCHELGINGFFEKPFNPVALRQKIEQILNIKVETN